MHRRPPSLALAALLLLSWNAVAAGTTSIVVCYPGGTVSQTDADAAMSSMLRVIERVGGWPERQFSNTFTSKVDECRKLLTEKKPAFAITSLGQYLALRASDSLVPLVQPKIDGRTSERYRVVVRKGAFADLAALQGHSLGGMVLEEPEFVSRIVLAGAFDLSGFDLKPSHQAIRALRSLDAGELDAVILNEQQYSALGALSLKTPLDVIFTSEEIPLAGVAANDKLTTADERARFVKALESMCGDAEGRKLCDVFGVQAFVAVDPQAFHRVMRLWAREG